jgi:hypothetical protein
MRPRKLDLGQNINKITAASWRVHSNSGSDELRLRRRVTQNGCAVTLCPPFNNIALKRRRNLANRMVRCMNGWTSLPASRLTECVIAGSGIIWPGLRRSGKCGAMKPPKPPASTSFPISKWSAGATLIPFPKVNSTMRNCACFDLKISRKELACHRLCFQNTNTKQMQRFSQPGGLMEISRG